MVVASLANAASSYDAIRYNIPRYNDCDTTGDTIVIVSFSTIWLTIWLIMANITITLSRVKLSLNFKC